MTSAGEAARFAGDASQQQPRDNRGKSGFRRRLVRFVVLRLIALFITIVAGAYLTILIANMGGYVDEIRLGQIQEQVAMSVSMSPEFQEMDSDQRRRVAEQMVELQVTRLGLDQPFLVRSFRYLRNALTLDLGRSEYLISDSGSRRVRNIILERLGPTLLLFATAELGLFLIAVVVSLFLSRRYGSRLDRFFVAMAPTSAAPSWFYGLFLILIFAAVFRILPFGGMVAAPPPQNPFLYVLSLLRHLILPASAIVLSALFLAVYSWRTFFLIYSNEDYVELARAKGLPSRVIERRYVLRPTLPTIVTSFALTVITLWTGAIVLEQVFNWPGLGTLFVSAVNQFDTPVIIGSTIVYAYLLGVTVFVLDFLYALIDPRIKVGFGEGR